MLSPGNQWASEARENTLGGNRSVAGRILEALGNAGAGVVFGLPGVHNLTFWQEPPGGALPRLMNVRHEQTTVYAADGWARASGCLGGAVVTTGPGAANAVAAFGEAAMSRSPVVLVSSEVPLRLTKAGVRHPLHQSKHQARIFETLAKAVFTPRSAVEATEAVGRAIATALTAPRGPVYMDVPADVLGETGPPVYVPSLPPAPVDETALAEAATVVDAAGTLVIWAGGGVVDAGATDDLAALAAHLQAPVFTTFGSRGAVAADHPCNVGLPPHEPEVEELLASADVLLAIGSDFDGMMTKDGALRLPHMIVDVNLEAQHTKFGDYRRLLVLADAKAAIKGLLRDTTQRHDGLVEQLPALRERVWERLRSDPRTRESCAFVATVQRAAGVAIVVNDMAIPGYWLSSYFGAARPRTTQYPVGWGTLGYALPASIGAACSGDRPVLAVCGDGGFMFAAGELATIAQEQLPITVLLVNDGGYGMLRYDQEHAGDARRGVDLMTPDFVRLAESFGIGATRVDDVGAPLRSALERALASRRPHMVVCNSALFPPRTTSPRWNDPP